MVNFVFSSSIFLDFDYSAVDDGDYKSLNPGWDESGKPFDYADPDDVCRERNGHKYCNAFFRADRVSGRHSNRDYELESKVKFFVPPGITEVRYTTGHKITARRYGIAIARYNALPKEPEFNLWEMSWDEINSHDWDEPPSYHEYLDGRTKIISRGRDFSLFSEMNGHVKPEEAGWVYIHHLFTGCANSYGYDVDYDDPITKCSGVYYPEISIQKVQMTINSMEGLEEYNKWIESTGGDPTKTYHTSKINPLLLLVQDRDKLEDNFI